VVHYLSDSAVGSTHAMHGMRMSAAEAITERWPACGDLLGPRLFTAWQLIRLPSLSWWCSPPSISLGCLAASTIT